MLVHMGACMCMCFARECVTCFFHSRGSIVFGQSGQTIDWNWTSHARGVCLCVHVCVCVCVCVSEVMI